MAPPTTLPVIQGPLTVGQRAQNRIGLAYNSPQHAAAHERAVTRAQASLTSPEVIAEGQEIARLSSTHEGRRELAGRMSARLVRIAESALNQVKWIGAGGHECRPTPDHRTAMECLRIVAALQGANAPVETKVELSGDLQRLTDEELETRYLALIAAAAKDPK